MRKIYLSLFFVLATCAAFSQVSVTATLATNGPTIYVNLKAAFDAINVGTHKGVINIVITGNTNETLSVVLNASGNGAAAYTSLSIKPANGVAGSISGMVDGPLLDLNGASNVTIDGLNMGGGSLFISNSSTGNTNGTSTIRFINDASNNNIQNATLLGASTAATLGTVLFGTGTITGNDNNTITNCNIANSTSGFATNAIYANGNTAAGQENSGNVISFNNISNFFNPTLPTGGILVAAGNTAWAIANNKLFQTAERVYTTATIHRGIQVSSGNDYSITGNTIGYGSASGTGIYTMSGTIASRFIAIDVAVDVVVATSVQNNTINGFYLQTSSGASTISGVWCGINITAGAVNVGTIAGNTIGSMTVAGSVVISPTTGGAGVIPINSSSIGTIDIENNNIGGIDLLPNAALSGSIQGIQATGASGTITIANNVIGSEIPNSLRVGIMNTTTGNGLVRGVLNSNSGTISIMGNTIRNMTHNSNNALALFRAIECQQGTATIIGNSISNITTFGTATSILTPSGAGILATTALTGLTIEGNTISNLNTTNSTAATGPVIMGIYLGSAVNGVTVVRNKLLGFTNAGTATSLTVPSIMAGIYMRDAGTTNPNILVANNMVALGTGQATNSAIIGIWNGTVSVNSLSVKIYYNSVNIEGVVTAGAQPSFCYYRGDFSATSFSSPALDIKNNLFTNNRTGGTGKHYAIANSYPNTSSTGGWASNASDYNILDANTATVGYWSANLSFANWQTAANSDAHSYTGVAVTYLNPAADLHLQTNQNGGVDGKAIPIATTPVDFDSDVRSALTPDIGADEFVYNMPVPIHIEYFNARKVGSSNTLNWKANCTTNTIEFDIERSSDGRKFNSIGHFGASQLRCAQPFDFNDNNPTPGTNYYRLRMKEPDGTVYYSVIVAILNKENGLEIVSLIPTLVTTNKAILNISSAQNIKIDIVVSDANGKLVHAQTAILVAGSNMIDIDLGKLAKGVYQISGYTNETTTRAVRFVKQ